MTFMFSMKMKLMDEESMNQISPTSNDHKTLRMERHTEGRVSSAFSLQNSSCDVASQLNEDMNACVTDRQ